MDDKLTPGRAVRAICVDCVSSARAVKDCGGDRLHDGPCLFFTYRMGRGRPSVKLIRRYCLWCMGGKMSPRAAVRLVKDCPSQTCPLRSYRMGRNPECAGKGFFALKCAKSGSGVLE